MRVLIISPHFPPSNAADMQRVRLTLPYLQNYGIQATVLAVSPDQVASPQDPWLLGGLPTTVPIHRVRALSRKWSRLPGLGTLSGRAYYPLRKEGDRLLGEGNFDLLYFSTTQFSIQLLGPLWKKRHRIPYILDYQDPWVSDYYRNHPNVIPPGGRLKYALADFLNRRNEPVVLEECSGFTSVSPVYPQQLAERYPDLKIPSLILPFPGDTADLERVQASAITQNLFDPHDGRQHWLYVGRGGNDMTPAVRGIFAALARDKGDLSELRLHFVGTSYAAAGAGRKTIQPLASDYGLEGIVEEHPDRIPYSEAMRALLDAHGLLVPGSDDPAYTASKIYPYLLANRPMLAVFHEKSSVTSLMQEVGGGSIVPFHTGEMPETIADKITASALLPSSSAPPTLRHIPLDPVAFRPYDARSQAEKLATFFQTCLK